MIISFHKPILSIKLFIVLFFVIDFRTSFFIKKKFSTEIRYRFRLFFTKKFSEFKGQF